MIKRKAVKKIVKKQIAEAIEEYEKTRANPGNAGGSGPTITGGMGIVGLRRWTEKVEQVFEICKCAEEDKVMFAASTFKGVDIEAYNNHFHELALMCLDLVPNEKKKVESNKTGGKKLPGPMLQLQPKVGFMLEIYQSSIGATYIIMVVPSKVSEMSKDGSHGEGLFGINKWYQSFALRNFDLEDMELESTNSGPNAKLPILKLGEYEMWAIRIKQYFQIQDYALWEVIENGDSWVSVSQTTEENGITVTKMSTPVTAEEKTNKKNDVKARGLLLMALPNEHQLTFSQYPDAKSMFAAIETRFGGNAATKKTQKTLLKQQYENFSATITKSLDSIFNRLQKIVSRLAILGVIIAQEDLNLKFLSSLPPEWNTHVVVWMNKPKVETMSIDDLYNNFKIVEQKVKKIVGTSSGVQNLAFMTAPSSSSTNDANTASSQVSAASPSVNTTSPQVCTASVSDNTVYAFMVENLNGSNVLHQDLEQIHEDDLEAMDLKWQLSLLSVRAKKYYQRTGKKIFINGNDIAGYDNLTNLAKGDDYISTSGEALAL
ncbi:hypothetical protein Tco_0167818 [Tanacetum coccineum]